LKKTYVIPILLFLILTTSCSNQKYTLNSYANYPVKFAKQKIEHPSGDFSIFIPKNWTWEVEKYEIEQIMLGIDAGSNPDKDGFIDIISILKTRNFSDKKDLKSEVAFYLNLLEGSNSEIIDKGETQLLEKDAYFFHYKSNTGTYGELETITFVLTSDELGVFYILNAGASQTSDLKKNMATLIKCLRTFKSNNSG
jgi:hypothetical protein